MLLQRKANNSQEPRSQGDILALITGSFRALLVTNQKSQYYNIFEKIMQTEDEIHVTTFPSYVLLL